MERNYKAFISYRHLPIDAEVAQKLHRTIESYIIPKDYRRNGEKKLGLVFRDKDELPITSNLSENLRMALEHSEYLIVICSPKTKESVWVLEEIEYFIQTHDRDHVLVFLVDGTMEESVPHQLTKVYNANGEFIQHVEPLAANIVADSKKKRDSLFKVEVLRILATLIQCPFDALYRREMRRKMKRAGIITGIVFAVVFVFVGMLWNRNQEIKKRLQETQVKESEITAILSEEAEKDGEYEQAIEYALEGIPETEDFSDRPFVPESEYALSNRIKPYTSDCFTMTGSFVQETPVWKTCASSDGEYLVTYDSEYTVRIYGSADNKLMYSLNKEDAKVLHKMFVTKDSKLVLLASDSVVSYDLLSGRKVYEIENLSGSVQVANKDLIFAVKDNKATLYSARDGQQMDECTIEGLNDGDSVEHVAITEDGSYLAVSYAKFLGDQEYWIAGWDLKKDKTYMIQHFTEDGYFHNLCFTDKNMLITGHMILQDRTIDMFYFERKKDEYKQKDTFSFSLEETSAYREDGTMYLNAMEFLETKDQVIYLVNRRTVYFLDLDKKEKIRIERLSEFYDQAKLLDDGSLAVVTGDGRIVHVSYDKDQQKQEYKLDFSVRNVSISGDEREHLKILVHSMDNIKQCTCISWKENNPDSHCLLPASEKEEGLRILVSRDGNTFALYTIEHNEETNENILHLSLFDQEKKLKEISLVIPAYNLGNRTVLTKKCLISDLFYINLETEEILDNSMGLYLDETSCGESLIAKAYLDNEKKDIIVKMSKGDKDDEFLLKEKLIGSYPDRAFGEADEGFDSHWIGADVVSINDNYGTFLKIFWQDDTVEDYNIMSSYWFFDTQKDTLVELFPMNGFWTQFELDNLVAVSEDEEYAAYVNQNKEVEIRKIWDEEEATIIEGLNGDTVGKLYFDRTGSNLLVMTDSGEFLVYSVSDGSLVYQKSFGNMNITFSWSDEYQIYYSDAQNRMIIIWSAELLTRSAGFIYDCESQALVGSNYDFVHYFKDTDRVAVNTYQGGVYTYPLYSREDLKEIAKEIVK